GLAVVASPAQVCGGGSGLGFNKSFTVKAGPDSDGSDVINCPGCDPGTATYRLNGPLDVLALVYTGRGHDNTIDCGGVVRRSLVNHWANLFQDTCTTGSCTRLRHAWRPADLSDRSDALMTLLGMPSLPALNATSTDKKPVAYCNAWAAGPLA